MRTNLDAVFYVGQSVARRMIERGEGGKIVNVCSVQSELARPGTARLRLEQGGGEDADQGACAPTGRSTGFR